MLVARVAPCAASLVRPTLGQQQGDAMKPATEADYAPVSEAGAFEQVEGATRQILAAPWPTFMVGQPEKPVRVVVVDDDAHIRRVVAQELMADPRTLLVDEGCSLRDGRRVVREHEFDVMLVDLNLGDGRGYELISYAKELRSSAEVVVLSEIAGPAFWDRCARELDFPLVDPGAVCWAWAEMAANLHRGSGYTTSKIGGYEAPSPARIGLRRAVP